MDGRTLDRGPGRGHQRRHQVGVPGVESLTGPSNQPEVPEECATDGDIGIKDVSDCGPHRSPVGGGQPGSHRDVARWRPADHVVDLAAGIHDADRAARGARHVDAEIKDAPQDDRQLRVPHDRRGRPQQSAQRVLAVLRPVGTHLLPFDRGRPAYRSSGSLGDVSRGVVSIGPLAVTNSSTVRSAASRASALPLARWCA